MKLDMHCHTRHGSIDSRLSMETWASILKAMGYDGMVVTDHDSFGGYNHWRRHKDDPVFENFVVICGVEYDTRDAGHILVILPDGVRPMALTMRGGKLRKTIELVHKEGGVLGPAHPYGARGSSAMLQNYMSTHPGIINQFDFIETFNTCESPAANELARKLAAIHGKQGTAGTDAHKPDYLGMATTVIDADIRCNDDMIRAIKEKRILDAGGIPRNDGAGFGRDNLPLAYSLMAFNKSWGRMLGMVRGADKKIRAKRAGMEEKR